MKLLIITGLYRSGTTLVQKILDSHSKINIINQGMVNYFKYLEILFFKKMECPFNDRPLGLEFFRPDENYKKIFNIIDFGKNDIEALINKIEKGIIQDSKLEGQKITPSIDWINCLKKTLKSGKAKNVLQNICESILLYRNFNNITYCGFKELNLEQFIEPLINAFNEDVKIIQIIRDPRAVLLSRNYGSFYKTKTEGKIHPLLLIAKTWRTSIRYKLFIHNYYPTNFLPVYYEQLVSDPSNEIKRICDFLSIEFSPDLLDFSKYKNEENQKWKVNTSFQKKEGFDTKSIDKWKDILPKEITGALEFMCCHEMMIEGYRPIIDEDNRFKAFLEYEDEKDKIRRWTFKLDLLLDSKQKKREIARNYFLSI